LSEVEITGSGASFEDALDQARRLAEAREWADLASLVRFVDPDRIAVEPELGYLVADAIRRVGRGQEAGELARSALAAAIRTGDRNLVLRSLNLEGMLAFEAGSLGEAQTCFESLLARASEWESDEFVARASNNLGVIANVRGEREVALTAYQRALPAYYRLGHARGLAQTYYNLGISFRDIGFLDSAERHYASATRYAAISRSEDVAALVETERALLRILRGDGAMAESIALLALRRHEAMRDPAGCANAIRVLALAAEAQGHLPLALERLAEALSITEVHHDLLLRAEIDRDRGRILHATGDCDAAADALRQACDAFGALGASAEEAITRTILEELTSQGVDRNASTDPPTGQV
jgi:tetratricopeptide (TPR) repeat protein